MGAFFLANFTFCWRGVFQPKSSWRERERKREREKEREKSVKPQSVTEVHTPPTCSEIPLRTDHVHAQPHGGGAYLTAHCPCLSTSHLSLDIVLTLKLATPMGRESLD